MRAPGLALCLLLLPRALPAQVLISLLFGESLNTGRVEFGLDGGLNLASQRGADGGGTLRTWHLGFYFDIRLDHPAWLVHTGVIVKSTVGAEDLPPYPLGNATLDSVFGGGRVTTRLQYFHLPLLLKYRLPHQFYLEGGGMAGLLRKGTDEFSATVEEEGDLTHERDVTDDHQRLDAGLVVGAGYRLLGGDGINLGVRYYHGLVNVLKDDARPGRHNRSLYLAVGIPVGAGSKEEPAGGEEP
ncbi:MAG TPA: porin family protein [Gemmatimonadales bacterium]|nr:porin family protein [Gemmatimonadales bacterium]